MMFLEKIAAAAAEFMNGAVNYVAAEDALRPDLAGMRIYDEPLFGAAAADDPAFAELRRAEVLHPEAMLPHDWLPGARSVISFFLPFMETVRSTNSEERAQPSDEWLHARIEGQMAIAALGEYLKVFLEGEGAAAVFPTTDARFKMLAPYASTPTGQNGTPPISAASAPSASRRGLSPRGGSPGASAASSPMPKFRRRRENMNRLTSIVRCAEPVRCSAPRRR
ncbi:MAG: hypothetical protein LUE09_13765 [Synergistaceae bacterium]|nr:hypothetical protein [Synergistaceae bacterium]